MANGDDAGTRLASIIKLKRGSTNILDNRESSRLEFKRAFHMDWGNYAKSIAAFANTSGGFIVFGVENKPHKLVGVTSKIDSFEPAKLTDYLNAAFSPEIDWELDACEFEGIRLGYLYTREARVKPVVCTKNVHNLKEGELYYRYRAQTTRIKYPELRRMLEEMLERERQAWRAHLTNISRAGPTNVGVLDTVHGTLSGAAGRYIIDENLLRDLKIIREGSFKDTVAAAPALKLVGELQPAVSTGKTVYEPTAVHYADLVEAFLAQRHLTKVEAKLYLQETAHQSSSFVPVHYFRSCADLSAREAEELVRSVESSFKIVRGRLGQRLLGKETIEPIGVLEKPLPIVSRLDSATFRRAYLERKTAKARRSLFVAALKRNIDLLDDEMLQGEVLRFSEALTHLKEKGIESVRCQILRILLGIFAKHGKVLTAPEKGAFRKAVSFLDEQLYGRAEKK